MTVPGGLPLPRNDQVVRPGPERIIAPGGSAGTVRARIVIISGPADGLFVYQGAAGLGTLVYSVTEGTSDPYGNPTMPGATSYSATGTINENGGVTTLYDAGGNPQIILDAARSALFVYQEA